MGRQTNSIGENGVALGYNSFVRESGSNAVALGANAGASGADSVALGSGSRTYDANTVSVGSGNGRGGPATRRIVNVGAGTIASASTDAINGGQLFQSLSNAASFLGGGAAIGAQGVFVAPTYVIQGASYNNVGAALTALDSKVGRQLQQRRCGTDGVGQQGQRAGCTQWRHCRQHRRTHRIAAHRNGAGSGGNCGQRCVQQCRKHCERCNGLCAGHAHRRNGRQHHAGGHVHGARPPPQWTAASRRRPRPRQSVRQQWPTTSPARRLAAARMRMAPTTPPSAAMRASMPMAVRRWAPTRRSRRWRPMPWRWVRARR